MSEPKLISPMLDDFAIGGPISDHNGVRCFPAMKNNSDQRYIVKIISIPASQVQLHALLLTGAYKSEEAAMEYFEQLTQGVQEEVSILSELSKLEGFLPYEACQVVRKDDEVGFDIYLLGTYKRSLQRHFRKYPMTHLAAVNLGLDMCASLAVCRQSGYLYADLKPGNIFISDDNEYRIGDLGFLKLNGLKYATLPDRYRSPYTAPELADPFAAIGTTVDTYAAGLILYQAYNGGVLPFEGQPSAEPLPAPMYADYEMAEIILKACAPDPADRWEDPIKMGQALVSYMQRNGVNDTPIVPPPANIEEEPVDTVVPFEEEAPLEQDDGVIFEQADEQGQMMIEQMLDYDTIMSPPEEDTVPEEEAENEEPEAELTAEEPVIDEDDPANLSFLDGLVSDETAPQEEMADDIVYSELSDDACNILAQADDLIAHETPAPAVAPEAIDVPIPPPIVPEPDPEPEAEPEQTAEEAAPNPVDETVAAISEAVASDNQLDTQISSDVELSDLLDLSPDEADGAQEPEAQSDPDGDPDSSEEDNAPKRSTGTKILIALLIVIIAACIVVTGYLFYRDYYMKTIDEMQISGMDDHLTVSITTSADQSLITVVCTDTYGNRMTSPLSNGTATFTDLSPDSLYKITLEIDGFHGLKGETSGTYTTEPQTEIMSFNALTGAEAGSAILNFTIKGHDSEAWIVSYTADGEPKRTATFSGHMTTITGLTVGKTYTFTLDAAEDGYVVGQNQIEYAATELIYPEDLQVTEYSQDGITVTWKTPEGVQVDQWTVMCYDDSGYNQNTTTTENSVFFAGIDPSVSYTVEVTASGMSVGERFYLSENAVSITSLTSTPSVSYLDVTWEYTGTEPASDWLLTYTIDDDPAEHVVNCSGTSARIDNIIPNTAYHLKLQLSDSTTVVNGTADVQIPEAPNFEGYTVSAANMTFQMCVAPDMADWNRFNVQSYTSDFTPGQKAGFVMRLSIRYNTSPDIITTMYVIRDSEGKIVSYDTTSQSWTSMWYQYYGELVVPALPSQPGEYTIELYFNGMYVHQQSFTITAAE